MASKEETVPGVWSQMKYKESMAGLKSNVTLRGLIICQKDYLKTLLSYS